MAAERQPIRISSDSELSRVLRDALEGDDVLVDTGETVFVLAVHRALRAPAQSHDKPRPSAEQVARSIEGIQRASGGWKGLVDAEELKAYIHERRKTANRPSLEW